MNQEVQLSSLTQVLAWTNCLGTRQRCSCRSISNSKAFLTHCPEKGEMPPHGICMMVEKISAMQCVASRGLVQRLLRKLPESFSQYLKSLPRALPIPVQEISQELSVYFANSLRKVLGKFSDSLPRGLSGQLQRQPPTASP